MVSRAVRLGVFLWTSTAIVGASPHAVERQHATPYAGQQQRVIKSLSAADVEALAEGLGWGLAKPAELNGYPGPLHLLEFADELELTEEQVAKISAVFERMRASAQVAGTAYLNAERALDTLFATDAATPERVERLTQEAGRARATLQAVHLQAHLETRPLLSEHQRHLYTRVRGYDDGSAARHHGHTQGH